MASEAQVFTYQTRIVGDGEILQACATLLSQVERKLFADLKKSSASQLKSSYLKKFGITARHFNAIRVQLEGKIASIRAKRTGQISEIQHRLKALSKQVAGLEKRAPQTQKLHQKKRYLFNLEKKLERLHTDQKQGRTRLCFGSKKLFRAQFALADNQYASHETWRAAWRASRDTSFFLIGSKDETSGNQSCSATVAPDGSLNLRLRLPDSLNRGKYLNLPNIRFTYGHEQILKALTSSEKHKELKLAKSPLAQHFGVPISYRFIRDAKSWRVFVSLPIEKAPSKSSIQKGAIGLDLNANHLALVETDRFGNPLTKKSIPLNTYGKNQNQTKALIGDACAQIIHFAQIRGKPLVIENLDFQKKKSELKNTTPKLARMLSSLTYNSLKNSLKTRGFKQGIDVLEVNPAFTSVIGRVKFAKRYGLSIHQAAALCIGRRQLQASERVPRQLDFIPDGKGNHVTLSLPVRNRDKHVWTTWGIINRKLKAVLAAHFRATRRSSSLACEIKTNPKDCRRDSGTRIRQHNCSVDVSKLIYKH